MPSTLIRKADYDPESRILSVLLTLNTPEGRRAFTGSERRTSRPLWPAPFQATFSVRRGPSSKRLYSNNSSESDTLRCGGDP
ncbi:hypothetical protein B5V02_33100 [Mesorhizobium kowhaii]|uniref:KTSC domain-containing protein n=1 Tax=Mesorhizobium kowhaii TaxID=1300272 RepID=A0A2W7BUP5_9HYPH|nr:hypothetical protein B5V02_33100 [Mesorhizobium kowhaii]